MYQTTVKYVDESWIVQMGPVFVFVRDSDERPAALDKILGTGEVDDLGVLTLCGSSSYFHELVNEVLATYQGT